MTLAGGRDPDAGWTVLLTMTEACITSLIAHLAASDRDDYDHIVHGVAHGEDELTRGLNGPKYWPAAELRRAADSLEGRPFYATHGDDREAIGAVLQSAYEPGVGVVYEAGLNDADIAEALSLGKREVSIEAGNPSEIDEHGETGAAILRGYEYTALTAPESGASPGNYTAPGAASENPAVAALSAASIEAALADAAFAPGDLVEWEYSDGMGHGRVAEAITTPGESVSVDGGTREATEDEAAYVLDDWSDGEFDTESVVKSESELFEWSDPPEAALAMVAGEEIDLTPPDRIVNAAEAGMAAKQEYESLSDCGTGVGEAIAEAIINDDLTPEIVLDGGEIADNGGPVTYLSSHADEAPDSPPTEWGEETWTDGCGAVQDALWGHYLDWFEEKQAEIEAAMSDEANLAALDELSPGNVVAYRSGDGTLAYGKVRAKIRTGTFDDFIDSDRVVSGPAVLIGKHEPGQGNEWGATDDLIARSPGAVIRHDGFPAAPASEQRLAEMSVAALADVPYEVSNVTADEIAGDNGPGFTDEQWDGDAVEASLPNPSETDDAADILDQTMALVPADDTARDAKSNWKAPFRDGVDSPVNTRALVAIDAAIDGARGGFDDVEDEALAALSDWVQSMLAAAPDDLFGADDAEAAAASVALAAATGSAPDDPQPGTGTGEGAGEATAQTTTQQTSQTESMGDTPDDNDDDGTAELEAELEAKDDRIAELEAENEDLREQNEAAREQYAAKLADADTVLTEDELKENFSLAQLAEKADELDISVVDDDVEPTVRSGSDPSAEANLSEAQLERKQDIEARLEELDGKDGQLAQKERDRLNDELAELEGEA